MNEHLIQQRNSGALASEPLNPETSRTSARFGSRRPYPASLLWIALGLAIQACGSSGGSQTSDQTGPNPIGLSTRPSQAEVEMQATGKCALSPMASVPSWQIVPAFIDTVIVSKGCYFETYYCEEIGYVTNDLGTSEVGIAKIRILYQGRSHPGCLGVGNFSCKYQASDSFQQRLYLTCQ